MKLLSTKQNRRPEKKPDQSDFSETPPGSSGLQDQPITLITTLLRTCKEVMIATFVDCYCNGVYTGLGQGTEEEMQDAWAEIVSEWSGLMKNEDADYLLELSGRILALKSHLSFVEYAVFYLQRIYSREIIDKLINEYGYTGDYPRENDEAYQAQLLMVISLSKTRVWELGELQDEYDRLENANKGKKINEEEFERNIQRLSKYQQYRIDKHKTSVFEYAQIHNNFIDEINRSNKNSRPPDA